MDNFHLTDYMLNLIHSLDTWKLLSQFIHKTNIINDDAGDVEQQCIEYETQMECFTSNLKLFYKYVFVIYVQGWG